MVYRLMGFSLLDNLGGWQCRLFTEMGNGGEESGDVVGKCGRKFLNRFH